MKNPALFVVSFSLFAAAPAACVPKRDLPPAEIQKLGRLKDVMDVQATVADPRFSKIDEASYTDTDWAAFADVGERIQVTSTKIKEFSKGPEFDALADRLHQKAEALSAAASAKNARGASSALAEMKATCKTCHKKFR
jgi:cytochrome c556